MGNRTSAEDVVPRRVAIYDRRDFRKGGRLDHDSGGHDDPLSAAGSAFWLARELKGRMGGYSAVNSAWASADLSGGGVTMPRLFPPRE